MQLSINQVENHNSDYVLDHERQLNYLKDNLPNAASIIAKLIDFQIAIPSWALGAGGTRFGRFSIGGEPRNLEEKMMDVGLLHALNKSSGAISLHIPWDIPSDYASIRNLANDLDLKFDAVNSNTFQDQKNQAHSYKFGSLQNVDKGARQQAIDHNIEVIKHGIELGSKSITVWLSDGSCFPGQLNFRKAYENTLASLHDIYAALPTDWQLYLEYKAYEPNFYSTTVGDWGMSYSYVNKLGDKAKTLVDLGHHLPNANIEQIVALLLMDGKLGGFHFNDSKYGDDDLTAGAIKPYQLFLIFCELVEGMDNKGMNHATGLGWMIDASHNVKDPLEDLLQSVEAIMLAYAQALSVDRKKLAEAQANSDVAAAQEILQHAFRTDLRPLLAEARLRSGAVLNPIGLYRSMKVRQTLIGERGMDSVSSGL
jgi:L-rhamnose isomerase / sugar isomerase